MADGVNGLDQESREPHVRGFVIEELSPVFSNWRSQGSLDDYLKQYGIPGIQGKLIFTPCPGTKDSSLVDSLATLKQAGASAVISLMPASELATNGAEDIGKQCQAQDMAWFHLPVADEQVPLEDFGQGWKASICFSL